MRRDELIVYRIRAGIRSLVGSTKTFFFATQRTRLGGGNNTSLTAIVFTLSFFFLGFLGSLGSFFFLGFLGSLGSFFFLGFLGSLGSFFFLGFLGSLGSFFFLGFLGSLGSFFFLGFLGFLSTAVLTLVFLGDDDLVFTLASLFSFTMVVRKV